MQPVSFPLQPVSFPLTHELGGWELLWIRLEALPGTDADLADLRKAACEGARLAFTLENLSSDPVVAAVRTLFRAAGCDPTRYRPSSEALIRRVLKGEDLPAIHPVVDLNNAFSVVLAVPCCAAAEGSFSPPVVLRAGRAGESYESLRGPFNLEGKPLLADGEGPFGTPITDSQRVKMKDGDGRAWMVAYLPRGVSSARRAIRVLESLLVGVPVARIEEVGVST